MYLGRELCKVDAKMDTLDRYFQLAHVYTST